MSCGDRNIMEALKKHFRFNDFKSVLQRRAVEAVCKSEPALVTFLHLFFVAKSGETRANKFLLS